MRDVTEILVHWQSGRPLRQIGRSLGVDRNTVRKYVALATALGYQPGQTAFSAQEWAAILRQHSPQLADPAAKSTVFGEIARFHEAIVKGLATNHATTVWQRLHDEHGLRASLRSFRRYLAHYLPDQLGQSQLTVLRPEPPAGQEAQIDFGYLGTWTNPLTGKQQRLWAFVMVLACSRHMFLRVVSRLDQKVWLEAHVAAFAFFGGAPTLLVVDNLKPGVLRADLYDPQLNRAYEELARHYGTLVDPCRAGHPKDKPRVERPIPYIRDSFWAGRTFESLDEINAAAVRWCLCVAGQRRHGTTHQRPLDLFSRVEAAALRPLPAEPFESVIWTQGKVAPDCHVAAKGTLYSLPYRYRGQTVAVRLGESTAQFYLDQELIKTHPRVGKGQRQTDWNDYPPEKVAFWQRTPQWCRRRAGELGPEVARAVEALLGSHALHFLRQSQGIIRLADKYGALRLNAACQRANAFGDPSYRTVRNILGQGLDAQPLLPLLSSVQVPAHLHGLEGLFKQEEDNRANAG